MLRKDVRYWPRRKLQIGCEMSPLRCFQLYRNLQNSSAAIVPGNRQMSILGWEKEQGSHAIHCRSRWTRNSEVSTLKQTAIKRAVLLVVSATGLVVSVAIAQTPSQDKDVIPPRSINLTAEQSYIIKEIVLTETRAEQAPPNAETKIGDRVPDDVKLQAFPKLVAEKVPQVKTYKFFVIQNQVVVVSPQDNVVADIIK